jgi:uncharacterized protein (TIGR00725 family)
VYVAVVGPGEAARPDDMTAAREVGRLLAEAGAIVLTGGLGGVMAAATDGANAAGGTTVALLPGNDRSVSSATVVIPTGLGELRNALLVGVAATLSEIALAQRTAVPVVCLGGWDVRDAAGEPLEIARADSSVEAVERILRACRKRSAPS